MVRYDRGAADPDRLPDRWPDRWPNREHGRNKVRQHLARACGCVSAPGMSDKKPQNTESQPVAGHEGLTLLGAQADIPQSPEEAVLERAANPQEGTLYCARFVCPEFTSLCPMTGQPDFAHLVIDYAPGKWLVESKSLKLFLTSFRNHGAFHEDCTIAIAKRLVELAEPQWLRIAGFWYPRGGIPIDVFYQTGEPPKGLWLPEPGVAPYRGRG